MARFLTFAEEPVTGSYTVAKNCRGRATITPKGRSEMHFSLVVVDGGNEMLAVETDADTVVSGKIAGVWGTFQNTPHTPARTRS